MSLPPHIKRFIPPVVSLAMFMESVDATIINTAIPAMSRSLHVVPIDLKIALISYLLSLAIFIPVSGWLADKFGIKKIFILALGVFTLSSIACGFSNNLWELVMARTCQGLGGSLMTPLGRLMIVRWFERTEFIQTMNRVIILALIGPALGPFLGGWITQTFSWRWIFWINVPFGILNILLAVYLLPEERADKSPPLDKRGFLLFGLGLAGFTFGLSALSESEVSLFVTTAIILISLTLLLLYIFHARHQLFPVLHTALFRLRTFRVSIAGNLLTRAAFSGMPFLLPLMLQLSLDYSPSVSGMMVATLAIGAMLVKSFSRRLIMYTGFRRLLLINTILLGLSLLLFATITVNTSVWCIGLYGLIFGFLMSLQFSAVNPLAFAEIPPEELSNATSIHSVTLQLAQSFGVALCALILKHAGSMSDNHSLTLNAFHHTFLIISLLTVLSTAVFLLLKKEDGANLISH
jgi:EmrB/QacA subfamily drug resistance transporter